MRTSSTHSNYTSAMFVEACLAVSGTAVGTIIH